MYNFKKEDFLSLITCWGIPQGNSVFRGKTLPEQIKEFKIDSVGKNLIKHSKGSYLEKTRLSLDGSTDSYHYGYKAYPTKQDALNALDCEFLIQQIKANDFSNLNYLQVKEIHSKLMC